MINFPIVEHLDVQGYGLYPGLAGSGGLSANFLPGLTLVLGTNGLGKSTLVSILYRLLTGPFDIPGLKDRAQLGNLELEASALRPKVKSMFAQRVTDHALNATARLTFRLGDSTLTVERRLRDLALTSFTVDHAAQPVDDEKRFQSEIVRLVGLWSFGDWILLLRHMIFYFEDRRALVWDPTAQRQLFRFLFLPPAIAERWTTEERAILELDSRTRNLSAALYREEQALTSAEQRAEGVESIREELKTYGNLQVIDAARVEALELTIIDLDAQRDQARLRLMSAEEARDARFRETERARLLSITARFPSQSETARYILAHLLTENGCLACGNVVPEAAQEYQRRAEAQRCVVCNSSLASDEGVVTEPELADTRVATSEASLRELESELAAAGAIFEASVSEYNSRSRELGVLRATMAERTARINGLVRQLPPAEQEMHAQRSELAALRVRVNELKEDLATRRRAFADFVRGVNDEIVRFAEAIKGAFDDFAQGFLLEECRLVWSPYRAPVGEAGELIDFPAFGLEMTGADFASPVRRNGPEQVSESQREFIDLSFRMALIAAAGSDESGTLVIDAPESSLDAVFAKRAADVLARFAARTDQNRVIVTSNLVEGQLIPELVAVAAGDDMNAHVVDLFDLAAPTAAVRKLRNEYEEVRDRLLNRAPNESA
jgi:energy-coupling factor transporter ATP-binding protein EcfA2